jgi:hypothetical protein
VLEFLLISLIIQGVALHLNFLSGAKVALVQFSKASGADLTAKLTLRGLVAIFWIIAHVH